MSRNAASAILGEVRRFSASAEEETPDRVLLERFLASDDQPAFTALVRRHGPLVLGLARRLLHDAHLAEDVLQAAFLALARQAGSLRRHESVCGWLYAVTWRLASRLRRSRVQFPATVVPAAVETPATEAARRELGVVLDEEIHRLPERLRAPIVLCYLEELTQDEAAARLGWSKGTLRRRLERGRNLLRARLTGRDATLGLGLCAVAFDPRAALPPLSTAGAATLAGTCVAYARGLGSGSASPTAQALAGEVARDLLVRRLNRLLLGVCALLLLVGGGLALKTFALGRAAAPTAPAARPGEDVPAGAIVRLGRFRLAHRDNVSCAAFSPDGKVLATGGYDHLVRLWDAATGRQRKALPHRGWVRSVVWAPDGKTLYSASDNEGVHVWDVASSKVRRRLGPRKGMVTALALPAQGNTLAFAVESTTVIVLDVAADRELFRVRAEERAYRLAFSPDGRTLVVGGEQKKIRRWQVPSGKELPALEGHRGGTYPVVYSRDGRWIASGGSYGDGHIHVWDAETGKEISRWLAHPYGVGALAFSPDGRALLSGHSSVPDTLQLWEVATGRRLRAFAGPSYGLVDSIAFTPDGKRAVSAGCWGRGIYLWDVATGREISPFPRHHGEVTAVAYSPDGKHLVSGSLDRTVGLWEASTGRLVHRSRGHRGPVAAVAVAPDGQLVASVGADEPVVRLWSRGTGLLVRELKGERVGFTCLAFSPDGKTLAAGEGPSGLQVAGAREPDRAVRLWNVSTGREVRRLHGKAGRVNALAFSPDGRLLATAGYDDAFVHLWDTQTGAERARLQRRGPSGASKWLFEGTAALAFAPDGRTLAAVSFHENKSNIGPAVSPVEKDVRCLTLWEAATGRVRCQVRLDGVNKVRCAAFVDGRYVALGFEDGTIRPLDTTSGQWLPAVRGHQDRVAALALSPDGRTVASGSWDTTVLVWSSAALIRAGR